MKPEELLEQIRLTGIVPVIAIEDAADAVPLADALIAGGLPCAEVTFRTAAAPEAIRRIAKNAPAMLLGAGTVLSVDQVKESIDCGAKFVVSPGLNRKVVEYCVAKGIAVTPGIATPSDLETALEFGLTVVKFFPAEAAGGLAYLKALAGPYGKVRFIPTGGIDERNLLEYLRFPKVLACGGSWMVKPEMIKGKEFGKIQELTSRALQLMLGFSIGGVSLPMPANKGREGAEVFSRILGLPVKEGVGEFTVGSQFRSNERGELVISVGTHFPDRGAAYLSRQGFKVLPERGGQGLTVEAGLPGLTLRIEGR